MTYIYFLPICGLLFHSLNCFFAEKNVKFDEVKFINFFLWVMLLLLYLRKLCLTKIIRSVFYLSTSKTNDAYFYRQCYALSFAFMSMIHFRLIFIYDARHRSRVLLFRFGFFSHMALQSFQHLLWKEFIFSLRNCLCISVKNQLTIYVWVYFWYLFSVLQICSLIYLCQHYTDMITLALL